MENASKALIIAGEILLGMMVVGIIIYLFTVMNRVPEAYNAQMSQAEIDKINSYFYKFENREDITAQEIVSVVNYAKNLNEKDQVEVKVKISPSFPTNAAEATSNQLVDFIRDNIDSRYKCSEIVYHPNIGLITSVIFIKQP